MKGYGYTSEVLSKKNYDYLPYKYVIFIAPVYFGQIHNEFIKKISTTKIKNLLIVYNGLNKESNNEDVQIKKLSINKYRKIKVYSDDNEAIREFIKREVI